MRAKPHSAQIQYQHQTTDTPSGNPVGEMWVDRFSSHIVEIDQIIKSPGPGSNFTVTITTVTPHFRAPGNNVRVDQVYIGTDPSLIYNGSFKVEDDSPWDPKKLKYIVGSDPSTPTANGFIGVAFQGITNDGGGTAAVVEGNRIFNTRIGGPYHDTFSSKDLIVRNNYYRSVVTGPLKILRGETLYPMPASAL